MTLDGRKSRLRKKAKRGFQGYPVATVAFYGPDDLRASKVAVGVVAQADAEPSVLERWYSEAGDVRADAEIELQVLEFIRTNQVRSVIVTDGIIGCPHEEVVDYPEGTLCPKCPYWAGRDRWTKERIQ